MTIRERHAETTGRRLLNGGYAGAMALAVLVILSYSRMPWAGFIWDDDAYVTNNPVLRTTEGLSQIWLKPLSLPQYYPLVHTTYWIEYRLWGLNPGGYHIVNVLLHATTSLLLWQLFTKLRVPGAWFAAALFAVHPVNVESVAWVTERKNTLSALFAALAAIAWLRNRFGPGNVPTTLTDELQDEPSASILTGWYAASLGCFLAALASKTVVITLPAALLVIVWWKRGRITWPDIAGVLPMIGIGLPFALFTVWLEKHHVGASGQDWTISLAERFILAGKASWFYATKLIWPQPIIFFYPRWRLDAADLLQWIAPISLASLAAALYLFRARIGRAPITVWLLYVGMLFPALGFFDVYPFRYSFVADHFQYHAAPAMLAGIAATITLGLACFASDKFGHAILLALIAALSLLAYRQTGAYFNTETMYTDVLRKNPEASIAWGNVGMDLLDAGRLDEAEECFLRAIDTSEIESQRFDNRSRLLIVFGRAGRRAEFEEMLAYQRSRNCRDPGLLLELAAALSDAGALSEAKIELDRVIGDDPRNVRALAFRAAVFGQLGFHEQAAADARAALSLAPDDIQARHNLAAAEKAIREEAP
jgi:protein O-mannosyl-transferase